MSRAEVFKIIDILPEPDGTARASDGRDMREQGEDLRGRLALWSSPSQTEALVSRGAPTHTIALEHVPLPELLDERLIMLREPESAGARSYRLLRHRLLSCGDPRIVAVTSAVPGEGKTTCALNLSLALAEDTMSRVLLLEANLRRPALGRLLGFHPAESLVENLIRFTEVGPPYAAAAVLGTRLHVAALPQAVLPEARLDRTSFAVALNDLRNAYDYIVVDAASVLESADADVIGECSNGVIVATRSGGSRRSAVRRAIAELAPARVLGSVLLDA